MTTNWLDNLKAGDRVKVLENINKLTIDQVERMLAIAKEGKQ